MPRRKKFLNLIPFLFGFLPLISTLVVSIPGYQIIAEWFFVVLVGITFVMGVYVHRREEQDALTNRIFMGVVIFMLLILVQNTGWFFSPLLFVLYLATIAIVLLYSLWSGMFFLLATSVLFFSYIDRSTPWYDYVRIVSFFTAVPLASLFSAEFLRLKQAEKEILIVKQEKEEYRNEVERLKANRLIWNDVMLRQSLATARNFALYWDANSQGLPPKLQRDLKRIGRKLDEALADIKKFEKKTVDDSYL